MLDTLFASRGRPGGSKKSAATSVLVHAAIIGAVVYGTARAVTPPEPKEQREEKIAYVAPKPEPDPLPKEAPKVRVQPKKAPEPAPKKAAPPKPRPAPPKPAPAPKVAVAPVAPPVVVPEKIPEVTAPAAPPGPTAAELAAKAAAAAEAELAAAKARADAEAAAAAAAKGRVETESAGDVSPNRSYDAAQVDVEVRALGGAPAPKYPERLRASNVEGQVSVRFIVGTNGRVEDGSIKILDSPDPAFSEEVKRVLMRTRYRPAEAAGHKVRQIVEQTFTFRLNS